jgi:aminoglycoside/choline kinase family phosphotransferase
MNKEENISLLFLNIFDERPKRIAKLPESGSNRLYYRIYAKLGTVIGVYNPDRKENEAFLSFTRTFETLGFPVPKIIAEDPDNHCYLISDLGDTTLYLLLADQRKDKSVFPPSIVDIYKRVMKILPAFQVRGGEAIDYGKCYPRQAFDRQSMLWDLNYFKYYFLKLAHFSFDEQSLEEDFTSFTTFLLQADADYFMYRDFQSRNIMLVEGKPYFIDYQGGRKGALQYDVASLLYDAKANLPPHIREQLLAYYLDELEMVLPGIRKEFLTYFPGFILIRILQALGAYGYRGYYEKKSHFLQSVPYALNNLRNLRNLWLDKKFGVELPTLFSLLDHLIADAGSLMPDGETPNPKPGTLLVTINSFSYKKGIPADPTENGGGFVFDCRALPNPGRIEAYKKQTGKDQIVIDFLRNKPDVDLFLNHVTSLVDQSVSNYLSRGFKHLFVNFGCTGGQHRSVYCAEKLMEFLKGRDEILINLNHTNLPVGRKRVGK